MSSALEIIQRLDEKIEKLFQNAEEGTEAYEVFEALHNVFSEVIEEIEDED